jgi:hypothetical protein
MESSTLIIIVLGLLVLVLIACLFFRKTNIDYINYGENVVRASPCTWHWHTYWKFPLTWETHEWDCTSETCPACGRKCERKGHPGNPPW